MKKLIVLAILSLMPVVSMAEQTSDIPDTSPHGDCADVQTLGFKIVKKIDKHHYELFSATSPYTNTVLMITKKAEFVSDSYPVGIGVKAAKKTKVKLENGFEQEVITVEECEIRPLYDDHPTTYFSRRKLIDGK